MGAPGQRLIYPIGCRHKSAIATDAVPAIGCPGNPPIGRRSFGRLAGARALPLAPLHLLALGAAIRAGRPKYRFLTKRLVLPSGEGPLAVERRAFVPAADGRGNAFAIGGKKDGAVG